MNHVSIIIVFSLDVRKIEDAPRKKVMQWTAPTTQIWERSPLALHR